MRLTFEWDANKARANFKKHKVGFTEAKSSFNDPIHFILMRPLRNEDDMKKAKPRNTKTTKDGMRREYDFSSQKGIRGKYYCAYLSGHSVRIREQDGTVTVQHLQR